MSFANQILEIQSNVPLASLTSWLVGGQADFFCRPQNLDQLKFAQKWAQDQKISSTILGGGSNVLISDEGVAGLVICMRDFSGLTTRIESEGDQEIFVIEALAGTGKSELLKVFLKNQLAPALFLAGLPGDVGGGVVMNAGVSENISPREFVDIIDWFDVLKPNAEIVRYQKKQVQWHYRHSAGWQPGVVIKAGFRCSFEKDVTVVDRVREANRVRLSKQPLDKPSCGSVFKNPETGPKAAQLIESCGLKGYTVGDAQVSLKHANFIVNLGKAKACDLWSIIEHVQKTIMTEKGVELKAEVVRLGRW